MRQINNDLLRACVDACRQGLCMEGPTYPKQLCFSIHSLSDHTDLFFNCPQGENAASTVDSPTSPCCSKSFMLSPPTEVWFGALRERDKARFQAGR